MKEKYISRVDSEKSKMYGYLIRLYRGNEVLFQQWIADKKNGGKEKALQKAIKIRDEKIKKLNYNPSDGKSNRQWKPVLAKREATSNTGHLGVYESHDFRKLKDGSKTKCYYIAASYVEGKGKSKIKKFYYGRKRTREEALQEAIKFRAAKEVSARLAAVEYNRKLTERLVKAENKVRKEMEKMSRRRRKSNDPELF